MKTVNCDDPTKSTISSSDTSHRAYSCYRHSDRSTRLSCTRCGNHICPDCSRDAPVGQQCPDCAGPPKQATRGRAGSTSTFLRTERTSSRSRLGTSSGQRRTPYGWGYNTGSAFTPMVRAIMVVTVAIHLLDFVAPNFYDQIFELFALANWKIEGDSEWWRLFTVVLLHSGFMHILFNMWALWVLGPQVERGVGPSRFLLFYLACAGAGSALSFQLGGISFVGVGASGAIFGLFGVWMSWAIRFRNTPQGRTILTQVGVLLAINLSLPLLVPNIAWQAHLGGLIVGYTISEIWTRLPAQTSNLTRSLIPIVVIIGSMLVILA